MAAVLAFVAVAPGEAAAQVFGTFNWQMQPYCNRVSITLTTATPGFSLTGSDDQCGDPTRGSVTGTGQFNPNGTVGLSFTIVTSPAGRAVHVTALVSPANGQGTWSDSLGSHGTFAFFAAQPGLPRRPDPTAPVDVSENPSPATDPCLTPSPPPMTLCGTAASRWTSTAFNYPPLQVWRDADGQVHLRGSVGITTGSVNGIVFVLPPGLRPDRHEIRPIATGLPAGSSATGVALLTIFPKDAAGIPGAVYIYNNSVGGHYVAHVGDVTFRAGQ